jgi:tetratricopeptide (TPR) repeat protein
MTGNQLNRNHPYSGSTRNGVSGEKPVINEEFKSNSLNDDWRWNFSDKSPRQDKKAVPVEEKDAGEESTGESGYQRGILLFRRRRWAKALRELLLVDGSSLSGEEQADLAYYIGLCCTKLERFDEALLYFEQHIIYIITGGDPLRVYQCRMLIAYIYIKTGRAKMAELELDRLLGSGFESVSLYNTLAYAAYVQKQHVKAIEWYEKALDIDGENLTAMNSMGFILADTGLDTMKAMRLCRKAVEKNPQNPVYLDSLGWASYKCGRVAEARALLRRAADIAPQEKEIKEHFRIVTGEVM